MIVREFMQGRGAMISDGIMPLLTKVASFRSRDRHFEAQALNHSHYEVGFDEVWEVTCVQEFFSITPYRLARMELGRIGKRWFDTGVGREFEAWQVNAILNNAGHLAAGPQSAAGYCDGPLPVSHDGNPIPWGLYEDNKVLQPQRKLK